MAVSRRSVLKAAGAVAGAGALSYLAVKRLRKAPGQVGAPRGDGVKRYDRAMLLGIDGLDPRVVALLEAEGVLPTFARLRREGAGGPFRTVAPAQSPVVWSTLASGQNAGRHGVFDFIHRDPATYRPFLSITLPGSGGKFARPRRNDAFWNTLTDLDVPVDVIRWPVTFPPESVNGRMLAGLGVPDIRGMLGGYTLYTNDASTAPDVPADALIEVEVDDGRIDTVVRGPRVRGLTGTSDSTLPMSIEWRAGGDGATVEVGGQSVSLTPNTFSEWVRLKFSAGALKSAYGIVKFRLDGGGPVFRLYATSVELDPERPQWPVTAPGQYAAQLAKGLGTFHTLGMPEDTKALNEGALSAEGFAQQCAEVTDERMRMFRHGFERFGDGVFAFVFDTSDRIQHMFWSENTMGPDGRVAQVGPHIAEHYRLMDAFLAEVLGELDDRTGLLVFSDHGFTSFDRSFDLNAWLVQEGYMTLTADPAAVSEDEAALYRLVDWSQTRAYGCGFSSLCVNVDGREGSGIVDRADARALVDEIAGRLAAYADPEGGAHPVRALYPAEDLFGGPETVNAPDAVVGCSSGYRMSWQTAVGGVRADVLAPNEKVWAGDHIVAPELVPGVIFSNAPLDVSGASAYDLVPTVLKLLGLPIGDDYDGSPLPMSDGATAS